MTLYSGQITQLLQGVSQQPPHTRAEGQIGAQLNCLSDIVDGLRRRQGSDIVDDISGTSFYFNHDMAYHSYDRGDGSESYMICVDTIGRIRVIDLVDGSLPSVTNPCAAYLTQGTTYKDIKFHTIADTTFILNSSVDVAMDTDESAALGNQYLIYCKRANYGKTYEVIVDGTVRATYSTPATVTISATTQDKSITLSTKDIITELFDQLDTWGGFTTIVQKNDIIYATKSVEATVEVTDGNHGTDLFSIRNNVKEYNELPIAAPQGYKIKISGLGETDWDDFWVEWQTDSGSSTHWYSPGKWQECIAPETLTTIDNTTMPVKLVRESNGDFTCSYVTWGERAAGDNDTNPEPSFIGETIADIGSYQNRLYTLTGENVVMSRAFDQLQFFAESVAQGSDDDPVDSASSDNQVTNLRQAVVFNDDLVIFSNNAQFVHKGSVAVTPSSFAVATSSKFNADPDTRPVVAGRSIIFPDSGIGNISNVWEYKLDTYTGEPICESVTKHLPKYISGYPYKVAADTSTGTLFLHMGEELAVLQTYYNNQERAQLAWHKWQHAGHDDTVHELLAIAVHNSYIYGLFKYGSTSYRLERMPLSTSAPTTNSEYEIFMDSMSSEQMTSGSYTIDDIEYNRRVPQAITDSDAIYVQGNDCDNPGLRILSFVIDSGYVYFNHVSSTGYVISGRPFESSGTLTNPYVKDTAGRPYTQQTTLDTITFNLVNAGYLEMIVDHAAGDTYTQIYNGIVLNHYQYKIGEAALLNVIEEVPVRDLRELVTLRFFTEHHLGFAIASIGWQARMTTRGRRSQ